MSQIPSSFTVREQIAIGLSGVLLGLPFAAFSLDTPVSHLMLGARTRPQPHSTDLEKSTDGATVTETIDQFDPVRDNLLSTTRKLWDAEGWRGFVKGLLPELVAGLVEFGTTFLVSSVLLRVISSRRAGPWRIVNAVVAGAVRSLILCYAVNPAVILRTRMRLQRSTRSTKEEIKYLARRVDPTDLFRADTIVPAFLRYSTLDAVRAIALLTILPAPLLDASGTSLPPQGPLHYRMMNDFLLTQGVNVLGTALAFPFMRCQELAAVSLKPLEEPSVRIHEYQGFADEIVKDSAWNGFVASLNRTVLTAAANLAMVLPPFLQLTLRPAETST
ncbi:protein of unknown function [Taphrina deformans PYCC 5710]|uniref:Mitochondrial carrier protein n=1 Tax=Taphrina deformans (strain PYCC 5710 / ATCC 11124 / CBS 356.35 / IMI 108563 / JCM 9778 / NBRC 8474) TaxID=1097556 RepID=R4XHD3_TAPDE|nr:protein of unknown function [Taphrina deformans PYCC 5710]|eukprot:CCG85172.1 protein of unknown function [Taphrina deformans PYCC 5710]